VAVTLPVPPAVAAEVISAFDIFMINLCEFL
jgi:hypothetical protein